MPDNPGGDYLSIGSDGDQPELIIQAQRIADTATDLLEQPDWMQTQVHFQGPFGPNHRVELLSRSSWGLPPIHEDVRNLGVYLNNTANIAPFLIDLTRTARDDVAKGIYHRESVDTLMHNAIEVDKEVLELVLSALKLRTEGVSRSLIDEVNLKFAHLLDTGVVNTRSGIAPDPNDAEKVYCFTSKKEGDQEWPEIDNEPDLHIRVKTDDKAVDFTRSRDCIYETFAVNPDTGREIESTVGANRVIRLKNQTLVFDLGDNKPKYEAVESAERAMGVRELRAEYLDFVEKALLRVKAARQHKE